MKTPCVGIADIVCAMDALAIRGPALDALVSMCGFGIAPESETMPDNSTAETTDTEYEEPLEDSDLSYLSASKELIPDSVTRLEPVRHEELSTLELAGDPLADSGSGQPIMDTAFERLYRLRDAREVLWSGASVAMRTERIDTDKAVDVLVRALPLDRLPRVHIPSIASGMELLLDIGQPMQPFAEDQQDLIRLAGEALGKPLVVKYFYDDPAKGVGSGRRRRGWQPYPLPPPGTPVIVISDMGCGYPRRQPATSGWLRLAWRLRQRACRLVVLSPTPADRVPVTLRRLTELVFWDRKSGRRAAACLRRVLDV